MIELTIIAVAQTVALVAISLAFLKHVRSREQEITVERRELLTRIQHPELIPVPRDTRTPLPEPEPDESNLVGTINYPED